MQPQQESYNISKHYEHSKTQIPMSDMGQVFRDSSQILIEKLISYLSDRAPNGLNYGARILQSVSMAEL